MSLPSRPTRNLISSLIINGETMWTSMCNLESAASQQRVLEKVPDSCDSSSDFVSAAEDFVLSVKHLWAIYQ